MLLWADQIIPGPLKEGMESKDLEMVLIWDFE